MKPSSETEAGNDAVHHLELINWLTPAVLVSTGVFVLFLEMLMSAESAGFHECELD